MTERKRNPYPMIRSSENTKPREGWTDLYVRASAYTWSMASRVTLRIRWGAQQANRRHREEKAGLVTALKERTRDLRSLEWLNQMGFRTAIDPLTLCHYASAPDIVTVKKDSWHECAVALGMKEEL